MQHFSDSKKEIRNRISFSLQTCFFCLLSLSFTDQIWSWYMLWFLPHIFGIQVFRCSGTSHSFLHLPTRVLYGNDRNHREIYPSSRCIFSFLFLSYCYAPLHDQDRISHLHEQTHWQHLDCLSEENIFNYQAKIIKDLAEKESCVIVGRCADYVLKDNPNVVSVFLASAHSCPVW